MIEDPLSEPAGLGARTKPRSRSWYRLGLLGSLLLGGPAPLAWGVGTSTAPDIGFFRFIKILYQNVKEAVPTAVYILVIGGVWAFGTEQGRGLLAQHGKTVVAVGMMAAAAGIPALLGVTGAVV